MIKYMNYNYQSNSILIVEMLHEFEYLINLLTIN